MATKVIFEGKTAGETQKLRFNYISDLAVGETVVSASVVATIYSGTDPTPAAIINGAASITTPEVTQGVIAGVLGVTYLLTCTALTSAGQTLQQQGFLVIIP